jgi:hypothetical protein
VGELFILPNLYLLKLPHSPIKVSRFKVGGITIYPAKPWVNWESNQLCTFEYSGNGIPVVGFECVLLVPILALCNCGTRGIGTLHTHFPRRVSRCYFGGIIIYPVKPTSTCFPRRVSRSYFGGIIIYPTKPTSTRFPRRVSRYYFGGIIIYPVKPTFTCFASQSTESE